MKNQKEKLKRIYKQMLNDSDTKLDTTRNFKVIHLGTTTTITINGKFNKVIRPDIVTLKKVYLNRKSLNKQNREYMTVWFNLNVAKNSRRIMVKMVPNKVLFGLFTFNRKVVYRHDNINQSAKFYISYGTIDEEISKKEYFELIDIAENEHKKRTKNYKKKRNEELEKRKIEDQNNLDNIY